MMRCSWRRGFAILVNFNLDPDALYAETVAVRHKLNAAIEDTKRIGLRARQDQNCTTNDPPQLYRLKHAVLSKQKLDRAWRHYEDLERQLLLPKHAPPKVMVDVYLEKGRFKNAHVRQVMGVLRSCCSDFEEITMQAWSLRERLHRDISMHRRFLEKAGIEVVDVNWKEILHWGDES